MISADGTATERIDSESAARDTEGTSPSIAASRLSGDDGAAASVTLPKSGNPAIVGPRSP